MGLDLFLIAVAVLHNEVVALLVVPAVLLVVAFGTHIERCHSDIEVSLLDDLFHVAEEEGHNKGSNVRTVHIGIRHYDNFVVADLGEVECFGVVLRTEGDA